MAIRHCYFSMLAITSIMSIAVVQVAWGQPVNRITSQVNCSKSMVQSDLNACASQSAKLADRKLNQVYQTLIAKINQREKVKLVDAQLAWIQFRDRSCEFESSRYEGGSIAPLIQYSCIRNLTERRTKDIEGYLISSDL
jgi:uncharacterized protein YecT (DUF1311 family)